MQGTLAKLVDEFSRIGTDEELAGLVARYSLVATELSQSAPSQVLGIYVGDIEGRAVRLTHRWYDPSQAFSIRPDINKLKLEIDGMAPVLTEFEDQ